MNNCIFCKIAERTANSAVIWEDDQFLAFLDIFPNTRGMALVIPRQHYGSYVFAMPTELYTRYMLAGQKVAAILERGLKIHRVAMVMEGLGVDHAHLKLYPLHGVPAQFKEFNAPSKIFFENYAGYISTEMGPRMDDKELQQLAAEIRRNAGL